MIFFYLTGYGSEAAALRWRGMFLSCALDAHQQPHCADGLRPTFYVFGYTVSCYGEYIDDSKGG